MDINEAIKARHSVRRYKDIPIKEQDKEKLQSVIDACNKESGLNIQLILNDPECFDTFLAHYGKFENAKNYIALVGKKSDKHLFELCGYFGQKIVLEAQILGLNTCWVAGTYGKGKCKAEIQKDEKLACVISIGYGETQGHPHNSKPLEKICQIPENEMSDWFKKGVEAALLAPTAINQQQFVISLEENKPVIKAKNGPYSRIDLGIVKFNFEVASGHAVK